MVDGAGPSNSAFLWPKASGSGARQSSHVHKVHVGYDRNNHTAIRLVQEEESMKLNVSALNRHKHLIKTLFLKEEI